VELDVIRDRNSLYREDFEGMISNTYTIKVLNMDTIDHQFEFKSTGLKGLAISIKELIDVKAGQVYEIPLQATIDPVNLIEPTTKIFFSVRATDNDKVSTVTESRFIGPIDP